MAGHPHLQLGRRPHREQPAAVHDGHAIAAFGFLHVVGRDKSREPALPQAGDAVPQLPAALRVQPGRRLVQEEHPGLVQERPRQLQPPFHPAGKRPHRHVGAVGELGPRERLLDERGDPPRPDPVEHRVQLQVLAGGDPVVQRGLLEDDADEIADPIRLGGDLDPRHAAGARRRREQCGQQVVSRRLARAVRAQQPELFTGGHLERHLLDRHQVAEAPGESRALDREDGRGAAHRTITTLCGPLPTAPMVRTTRRETASITVTSSERPLAV